MKTILVPIDFSPVARRVIKAACGLARATKARLLFLHVVEPPVMLAVDGYDDPSYIRALDAARQFSHVRLQRLERSLRRDYPRTRVLQLTGDPSTLISEKSSELKPAFLVIGSHGHGAVYDLFMGSTTQGVVKRATCPVLVVPPPAASRPRRKSHAG